MTAITKTSMKDQVYQIIKEKIFALEYGFGDTINISALSSELGVSNTPIREALSRLEVEGLVTSTLNSKVQVIDITEDLYKDIDHTFFSIISGCYTTCYLEDKIEYLLELMDEAILAQERALKDQEYMNYAFKAIEFDRCFVAATGNDYLLNTFDTKSPILYLLTRYNHQHPEPNRQFNLGEHQQILDAVKKNNFMGAQKLIYIHYDKHFEY